MSMVLSALVNGSIASAILAVAILILTSIRMWNAASRYIIWWVALVASVIITAVYFSVDAFHEAPRPGVVQNQLASAPVVVPSPNAGPLPAQQFVPVFADRGTKPSLPIRVSAGSVVRWAGFAWMLISALMLFRLIASYLLLERRKAAAFPIGSDRELRFRELFRRAGVGTRSIRIAVSDEIRGPIAIGPRRPTVLIPARLIRELDAFELDQVVLHEAAHLSRRDDYAVFIQRVIQAMLVFHPVVHWISRRIDIEREIACDDFVVLATGEPRPYASCLTRVAELCGCVAASPLAASAAGSGSALVQRIETLLDDNRKASSRPMKARLVLGATVILAVTGAGIVAPRVVAFSAAGPPASIATVNVQVVVTDRLHRYISGLQKENFTILEDGVEQSITLFDGFEEGAASVSIILDGSGGNRGERLEQVRPFLAMGNPENEFWVQALQPPAMSLFDALSAVRTQLAAARHSRRAIVIMSERKPDSAEYSREPVEALAAVSDVPVYVLTPKDGDPLLDALALRTGGNAFHFDSPKDAETVRAQVLVRIQNSYVLGFQPTKTADGEFRRLTIQIWPPKGVTGISWQNRFGYHAAAQ